MKINCKEMKGQVKAICSKSQAHRFMVCSFLAGRIDNIRSIEKLTGPLSEDLCATWGCIESLASNMDSPKNIGPIELACHESGTTLRMLMPVVAALGCEASFILEGSLIGRPNEELEKELRRHGVDVIDTDSRIAVAGQLEAGEYQLPANISSQYVSGLLLALPLLEGDSSIVLKRRPQSMPYIEMTLNAMKFFDVRAEMKETSDYTVFTVKGGQRYNYDEICIKLLEGDWSAGAMWLVANSFLDGSLEICGLDDESIQGDKRIVEILAKLDEAEGRTVVIDAGDIPDIIPAIALKGAVANARTEIINAERLRLKECDRLEAIYDVLTELGADIAKTANGLSIYGAKAKSGRSLISGTDKTIDTRGDHRMAMMAAVASIITEKPVTIDRPEAVAKSYPSFWDDITRLGGIIEN